MPGEELSPESREGHAGVAQHLSVLGLRRKQLILRTAVGVFSVTLGCMSAVETGAPR